MPQQLECRFFKTSQGTEPVRDWLKSLPRDDMKEIGADIQRIQWRWPISRPLVGTLGGGLFEVRTKIETVQYRVLLHRRQRDGSASWLREEIQNGSR